MKIRILIPVALVLVIGAGALLRRGEHYATIVPHRGDVVQAVYATGEVEPIVWAKISPQMSGRIRAVLADDGQVVKRGDVLAQLDDAVESAEWQELHSRQAYLRSEMQRYTRLQKSDFTSRQRYEQSISDYKEITARLDAKLKQIDRMHIRTPMDGIVLRRDVEPGETVDTKNIIFWVGQPGALRITAVVDEEDIPLVQVGQLVLIKADAYPGQPFEGRVAEVTPKGDPVDKNFRIRVSLPENSPLMVGMTVEVNIVIREAKDALLLPRTSLRGAEVYVEEDGEIVARTLKSGVVGDEDIEVLEGLQDDERVLENPALFLKEAAQ